MFSDLKSVHCLPGQTQFTLMPSLIKSEAIAFDIPMIAAFVAPYIHLLGAPVQLITTKFNDKKITIRAVLNNTKTIKTRWISHLQSYLLVDNDLLNR